MDQKSTDGINNFFTIRTTAMVEDLKRAPSSMSETQATNAALTDFPTSCMTLTQVLWVQRLALAGQDVVRYGIRDVDVWLGGNSPEAAVFTPLPHAQIINNLDSLIKNWTTHYEILRAQDYKVIVSAIAVFHYEFLRIHPFLDGNGRVARALLRQQIIELLGVDAHNIFVDKPTEYYESLQAANNDNLEPLTELIKSYSVRQLL
jgi:Fic family protein